MGFLAQATTSITGYFAAVSTALDTIPGTNAYAMPNASNEFVTIHRSGATTPGNVDFTITIPPYRVSLSASQSFHLVTNATFTTSTLQAYGWIQARRVR